MHSLRHSRRSREENSNVRGIDGGTEGSFDADDVEILDSGNTACGSNENNVAQLNEDLDTDENPSVLVAGGDSAHTVTREVFLATAQPSPRFSPTMITAKATGKSSSAASRVNANAALLPGSPPPHTETRNGQGPKEGDRVRVRGGGVGGWWVQEGADGPMPWAKRRARSLCTGGDSTARRSHQKSSAHGDSPLQPPKRAGFTRKVVSFGRRRTRRETELADWIRTSTNLINLCPW